jgi:hypothetical protein
VYLRWRWEWNSFYVLLYKFQKDCHGLDRMVVGITFPLMLWVWIPSNQCLSPLMLWVWIPSNQCLSPLMLWVWIPFTQCLSPLMLWVWIPSNQCLSPLMLWVWILSNQCLSPLKLWVWIPPVVRCTRLNIMWSSLSVTCRRSVVFLWVLRFPPSIKLTTSIKQKYYWKWH